MCGCFGGEPYEYALDEVGVKFFVCGAEVCLFWAEDVERHG